MPFAPRLLRYLAVQYLGPLVVAMVLVQGVVLLADVVTLMKDAGGREGVGFRDVLTLALLKQPNMVSKVLPSTVLVAAMYSLWRLNRHNELVIMRAAGLTIWRLMLPVMAVSLLAGVVTVAAVNPFAAATFRDYDQLHKRLFDQVFTQFDLGQTGLWLREPVTGGLRIIHARGVVQGEEKTLHLENISVFEMNNDGQFVRRLEGPSALLANGRLVLHHPWLMEPDRPSQRVQSDELSTDLSVDRIDEKYAQPETLSVWQMPGFIRFYEESGFSARRQRLRFYSILAEPLLLVAMATIGAVMFAGVHQRQGRIALRMTSGIVVGFSVYFFSELVEALALTGGLPLLVAALGPTVVAALTAVSLLIYLDPEFR